MRYAMIMLKGHYMLVATKQQFLYSPRSPKTKQGEYFHSRVERTLKRSHGKLSLAWWSCDAVLLHGRDMTSLIEARSKFQSFYGFKANIFNEETKVSFPQLIMRGVNSHLPQRRLL